MTGFDEDSEAQRGESGLGQRAGMSPDENSRIGAVRQRLLATVAYIAVICIAQTLAAADTGTRLDVSAQIAKALRQGGLPRAETLRLY